MTTQIVPIERTADGALIVSSLTIAEGSGVQHKNVLLLISNNMTDLERFGTVAFETRPLPGGGNPLRIALLNEQQSTLVMTYQRNTEQVKAFKFALVMAFFEMAKQIAALAPAPALSRSDLARMVLESEGEKAALGAELETARPKADYVDKFVADGDAMSFRTVASTLRIAESKLRALLIACEWIYREESERFSDSKGEKEPQARYSEYAAKKPYFIRRQEHKAPRFRGEVMHTLKITPPGGNSIDRLMKRAVSEFDDIDTAIETLEARRQERIEARKKTTKEPF